MTIINNDKKYEVDEAIIDKYMKNLDLSKEEAIQMWLEEEGEETNEEWEAADTKAKEVKINHGAEADKKKPRKPRERKVDEIKLRLINIVADALTEQEIKITDVKNEVEISFDYEEESYTFKLTKHRKKKAGC